MFTHMFTHNTSTDAYRNVHTQVHGLGPIPIVLLSPGQGYTIHLAPKDRDVCMDMCLAMFEGMGIDMHEPCWLWHVCVCRLVY